MGSIIVWAVFYIAAIFSSDELTNNPDYSPGSLIFNLVPYILGLVLSVWYLNLPHIKALFDVKKLRNEQNGE
jgi:hypothetical protein